MAATSGHLSRLWLCWKPPSTCQHTLPTTACSLGSCCAGWDRSRSVEPGFKGAGLAGPYMASCRSGETRPAHQGSIFLSWKLSGQLSRQHPSNSHCCPHCSCNLGTEMRYCPVEQKNNPKHSQCREIILERVLGSGPPRMRRKENS